MKINTIITRVQKASQSKSKLGFAKPNYVKFSFITVCIHTRKHLWHLQPEQMNTGGALLDYQDEIQITAKGYEVIKQNYNEATIYTTIRIHKRCITVINPTLQNFLGIWDCLRNMEIQFL